MGAEEVYGCSMIKYRQGINTFQGAWKVLKSKWKAKLI